MVPFVYAGPEGHNPTAGALYPGKLFYPNDLPSDLVIEWIEKGWLTDGKSMAEPDSAELHLEHNAHKRKG